MAGHAWETGRGLDPSVCLFRGDAFVDWIREKLIERGRDSRCAADAALRRHTEVMPVEDVLRVAARILEVDPRTFRERHRNSDLRGVAAHVLCRFAGLSQREAAAVLGMKTGAAVGQQLQRLRQRVCTDTHLRDRLANLEEALRANR